MIVTVGRVARAHGVRGEVAVDIRTDAPEERFASGTVLLMENPPSGRPREVTVRQVRWHQGRVLVQFEGVADRDAAEALRGVRLQVEIDDDARPDDPDEFFDHQLVGMHVVTTDDVHVGEVTEVIHGPGQELLAVRRSDGTEVLVPFVAEIVPEVDVSGARVVIDPPPGLLDLEGSRAGSGDEGRRDA